MVEEDPTTTLGEGKSNILLNNMCKVLNGQLVDGRDKPIITCLEYIREYLMKRIVNVQKVQDKLTGMEIGVEWDTLHTWDMASNGTDTGIPESYCNPCHCLCSLIKEVAKVKKCRCSMSGFPKGVRMLGVDGSQTTQTTVGRGCKSQKSGHAGAGAGSQGGGDAGVGGSQTTQRTQSSVRRAQHPSFLHTSPTKMTKSSAKRGGP
ncbi:hypothetical protein Tco_0677187 [Tanacetum coccineum]